MTEAPSIRVAGDNVRKGDMGIVAMNDPIGNMVLVGAVVHVEKIQCFDPLTGRADSRLWLRRLNPRAAVLGEPIQLLEPLWEVRADTIHAWYHIDCPGTSQEEYDEQCDYFGVRDVDSLATPVVDAKPVTDEAEADRKMDQLHTAIDNLITQILHRAAMHCLHDREDAEEALRDLLLEFSYAIQGIAV